MNLPLFDTDCTQEAYTAIVIDPNGIDCLRKFIPSLYDAKIWITEKIYMSKKKDVSKTFPYGLDYCIITKDHQILDQKQINLPESIQ